VLSPVDYDAWHRGYSPPTSHLLIHKLMAGELVSRYYTDCGPDDAFAIVMSPQMDIGSLAGQLRDLADMFERQAERKAAKDAAAAIPADADAHHNPETDAKVEG